MSDPRLIPANPWRARARGLRALMLSTLMVPAAMADAAELPLGLGDTVMVSVAGLPGLNVESRVAEDGTVDLLWIGRHAAEGLAIDDLERNLRSGSEGRLVKQYGNDGTMYIIQLEADDVNIMRTAYNPVVVGGSVRNPGQIAFVPGMTVREAFALAGGADLSVLDLNEGADITTVLRWQADYANAASTQAEATAVLWRVGAEIADDPAAPLPDASTVRVNDQTFAALIDAQREIMRVRREAEEGQRRYFEDAKEQALQRLDILGRQQGTLEETLAEDEAEEARTNDLVQRGLAPGTRASDARRTTVLSATRLLEMEETLARLNLEVTRLDRDAADYEERRLQTLLAEQVATQTTLRGARQTMEVIAQYLAVAGSSVSVSDMEIGFDEAIHVYRMTPEGRQKLTGTRDTPLYPGDTVEVEFGELDPDAPGAAGPASAGGTTAPVTLPDPVNLGATSFQ